ncbi:MAG TPA: hypothetical protein DFI01_08985, partial [Bacteroidales bacterium]|nr:hypothetical protein [Bacteroidales bacterium]
MSKKILFYSWIMASIIAGGISILVTLSIPTDSKNAVLFGLSTSRLAILAMQVFLVLIFIFTLFFEKPILRFITTHFNSNNSNKIVTSLGIISFFLLWITIFTPTKDLFEFEALFIRIKPLLLWLELILFLSTVEIKIFKNTFSNFALSELISSPKILLSVFLPLLVLWLVISITKVGLVKNTAYWNVPGIPLSTIQFIGIILFLLIGMIFISKQKAPPLHTKKFFEILIPILIYTSAVLLWGFTPMLKHFFSLQPTMPNWQPFPASDARIHDLGALSIVMGKGIYFHGYTDKPLYMFFLAILHTFARNNYNWMEWAQILVIALAPVVLYQFGKKFFGILFGLITAAMLVLQQHNAIVLSYKVASVNPKLLVSEELMLLGIIAGTFLLFQWMKFSEPKKVFILGGLIGSLSLVRINPIFIAPAVCLIVLINFWKTPTLLVKQLLVFGIGFILVFSPWLITGVNSNGESWFFLKIKDVIQNRYPSQVEVIPKPKSPETLVPVSQSSLIPKTNMREQESYNKDKNLSLQDNHTDDLAWIMFNHFLHNFSTSLLALPDSIRVDSLTDLSSREYWQDQNHWTGSIPIMQYGLILVNLALLSSGITISWKKYHWAGLAPIIIFLAYDISLSAALNSGSRYIVPINWIFFFYYALGLISMSRTLLGLTGIKTSIIPTDTASKETKILSKSSFISWLPSLATLVIVAALLPFANLIVPKLIHFDDKANQLLDFATTNESIDNQLLNGIILYPYYQIDGSISFDFLSGTKITTYDISGKHLISPTSIVLESGTPALISFSVFDDSTELRSIYIQSKNTPELFWQSN